MKEKYTVNWGVQVAGMIFQACSKNYRLKYNFPLYHNFSFYTFLYFYKTENLKTCLHKSASEEKRYPIFMTSEQGLDTGP